ncbi:hypothetical protein [Vibrio phage BONAISHI]|nr:hypothetical protein [Vibrio phage BONAISHI]
MFNLQDYFNDENFKAKDLEDIQVPEETYLSKGYELDEIYSQITSLEKTKALINNLLESDEEARTEFVMESMNDSILSYGVEFPEAITVDNAPTAIKNIDVALEKLEESFLTSAGNFLKGMVDRNQRYINNAKDLADKARELRDAELGGDKDVSVKHRITVNAKTNASVTLGLLSSVNKFNASRGKALIASMNEASKANDKVLAAKNPIRAFTNSHAPHGTETKTKQAINRTDYHISYADDANMFLTYVGGTTLDTISGKKLVVAKGDVEAPVLSTKDVLQITSAIETTAKTMQSAAKDMSFIKHGRSKSGVFSPKENTSFKLLIGLEKDMVRMADYIIAESLGYCKKSLSKYKK